LAKVNLCLFVGERREGDGRHELVTLFESVDLADELTVSTDGGPTDEVVCPGVDGPNLVEAALAALRAARWAAPPVRVEIRKRIPVAAGMGGGSADAAAVLRHAPSLAPVSSEALLEIAARLGADVPSQLDPGPAVGAGAGEEVRRVPDPGEHALLVLPQEFGLATAEVYRIADGQIRLRNRTELLAMNVALETTLLAPGWVLPPALTVNELQPAALRLAPVIARALTAAREAGAARSIVCGSGPTVIGTFWGSGALARAASAADALRDRFPGAVAVRPVSRDAGPGLPRAEGMPAE
jgi:4-diphosphocytidyl-2-C-methyl-D-erythritol kinase